MKNKIQLNKLGRMEMKSKADKAELYFYGDISGNEIDKWSDEDKCPKDIADFLNQLNDYIAVDIYINSAGGSVFGSLAIYNQLKRYSGYKIVHIDGLAASAASIIAMVGDKIIMPQNAQIMIHKPITMVFGNSEDFKKVVETLDMCQESLIDIYMDKVKNGITREQITNMINSETWLSGNSAAQYFNIELEKQADISACSSEYFKKYKSMPKNLIKCNEDILNIDEIAQKVKEKINNDLKENIEEIEKEKQKILDDIDLI